MKITERRLRQIIRNVIEESIKAESLDLSALAAAGLISSKEQSRIENEINEDQIRRDISQLKQTGEIGYSKVTADVNVSALNDLDDSKNISKQSDNSLTLNQDLNLFSQDLQALIISRKIKIKERSLGKIFY